MKRIFGGKGFTLVECIIAVAVFGLLSLVVFMILTNASVRAAKASDSEENLAQLIENVVGDDTYKKYDAGSPSLDLVINNSGSIDARIAYNVISGYKNYLECNPMGGTSCNHQANLTEFMSSSATSLNPVSSSAFDVDTCFFVCPHCGLQQNPLALKCPDCDSTGDLDDTLTGGAKRFTYLNTSTGGGFECGICGSTAVMAVDSTGKYISEKVAADGLSVSGMVATGIRYGTTIDWTTQDANLANKNIAFFRKDDPTVPGNGMDEHNGQLQLNLEYKASSKNAYTGEYTLQVYANPAVGTFAPGEAFYADVILPAGYLVTLNSADASVSTAEGKIPGSSDNTSYPIIRVKFTGAGNSSQIKFALSSRETGYAFEYDYSSPSDSSQQGLFRWFGMTVTGVDHDEAGCLKTANGNKDMLL